jgi:hypothetical protein
VVAVALADCVPRGAAEEEPDAMTMGAVRVGFVAVCLGLCIGLTVCGSCFALQTASRSCANSSDSILPRMYVETRARVLCCTPCGCVDFGVPLIFGGARRFECSR